MKTITNIAQAEKYAFPVAVQAFLPPYVLVPCNLMNERSSAPLVRAQEVVAEGQAVAYSLRQSATERTLIHSPLPGMVEGLEPCHLPDGTAGTAVKVRLGGTFAYLGRPPAERDWSALSREEVLALLAEKGVVNTFATPVTLFQQVRSCARARSRLLVVRMFDADPTHVTDSFVARNYTDGVIKGAAVVARALGAEGAVFAMPWKASLQVEEDAVGVPVLCMDVADRKYPSGFAQTLAGLIRKNARGTPFAAAVGRRSLFADPQTLYAAYEAVALGKPSIESFVQVGGDCLRSSAMFRVRAGTTVQRLADLCGGFKARPGRIIINGTITGTAVGELDTVITKEVKSVAFVPASALHDQSFGPCVRCGRCRSICPEGLLPDLIFRHSMGGKPVGRELVATAGLCSGCCLCNSVCPARLPLCQIMELVRKNTNENY